MGLSFRKSYKLFPGVKVNLSKTGVSLSLGVPGATINLNNRGAKGTFGIPGTGISYKENLYSFSGNNGIGGSKNSSLTIHNQTEIESKAAGFLTSENLLPLKQMIIDSNKQLSSIRWRLFFMRIRRPFKFLSLMILNSIFLKYVFRKSANKSKESYEQFKNEIIDIKEIRKTSKVKIEFQNDDESKKKYEELISSFIDLCNVDRIWDVTKTVKLNAFKLRSPTNDFVQRRKVRFRTLRKKFLEFDGFVMKLKNINGDDVFIYPGFAFINGPSDFALIDIFDLTISHSSIKFIEDERVPYDAYVLTHTWAKANQDGSRDKRFNDNKQIPVCSYGQLTLKSSNGLNEKYLVSNDVIASRFVERLQEYKNLLKAPS